MWEQRLQTFFLGLSLFSMGTTLSPGALALALSQPPPATSPRALETSSIL
jgi:hypothetical protein